jgi:AraC-like DNA-binding protein
MAGLVVRPRNDREGSALWDCPVSVQSVDTSAFDRLLRDLSWKYRRVPSKSIVSRLTRALVAADYLDCEPVGGKYQFRPRILTLVFSLLSNMRVLPVVHEQLQRLATASGCTVSLAWPDAPKMIYLDRCLGEVVPYYFSVGSAIDTARTTTGPSLSCFAPDGGNKFDGGHDLMRLRRRIDMHGCMHRYSFRSIAEGCKSGRGEAFGTPRGGRSFNADDLQTRPWFLPGPSCVVASLPGQWILSQRVEQARDPLMKTDTPLADVALACGVADQSDFTRVFSAATGLPPGAWRRATGNAGSPAIF